MKFLMVMAKFLMVIAAIFCLAVQPAVADGDCKTIHAVQHDVLVTEGCPSPVGFCAAGTVRGDHGLQGTSFFSALAFDPIPHDPLARQVVPGISTYTTDRGILTISDVSVLDSTRGTFAGTGRITAGTGRFAGASGDIFTFGRVLPDGVSFTTDVAGELCLP